MKKYKELPTGKVVEELIEKANRLRQNMIKSSLQKTTPVKKNNHRNKSALISSKNTTKHENKSLDILIDGIDSLVNHENIKSSASFNGSIITDLDGLENEQSLLDDLLYGGTDHVHQDKKQNTNSTRANKKNHAYGKPPTGRSRSPSLTRVSGSSTRPRSAGRSQSLTRNSDSDIASHNSFDAHNSDVDDSGNGKVSF
jgi:hypothetical protein